MQNPNVLTQRQWCFFVSFPSELRRRQSLAEMIHALYNTPAMLDQLSPGDFGWRAGGAPMAVRSNPIVEILFKYRLFE